MADYLVVIGAEKYPLTDVSRVSAIVALRAAEELPALGLTTTWDDLTALLQRSQLPKDKRGVLTVAEATWMSVLTIWAALNAHGRECSLKQAMDLIPDLDVIEAPGDHKGKAKAPAPRKGSARGVAKRPRAARTV